MMRKKLLVTPLAALCLLLFISSAPCLADGPKNKDLNSLIGNPAPDFTLTDLLTGEIFALADVIGKGIVYIEFRDHRSQTESPWPGRSTALPPFRDTVSLENEWGERGVSFITIFNVQSPQELETVKSIVGPFKGQFPILNDPGWIVGRTFDVPLVRENKIIMAFPFFFILDIEGVVRFGHCSDIDGEDQRALIFQDLLKKAGNSK